MQWIYRCVLVHDRNTGVLILAHKAELLKEIEHQLTLGLEELAEEDQFLLECNLDEIASTIGNSKGTGCLVSKQPERHLAYAQKQETNCTADPGNVRDGHKVYIVPPVFWHMLTTATR
jgi:hypothetical protein